MNKSKASTPFSIRKLKRKLSDDRYLATSLSSVSYFSDGSCSPDTKDYAQLLKNSLGIKKQRTLMYGDGFKRTRHDPRLKTLGGIERIAKRKVAKVPTRSYRHVPNAPFKVLDAPDIVQDFYRQHIDWSVDNFLAVALGSTVYLWNACENAIEELVDFDEDDNVSSVSFSEVSPELLAVSAENGKIGVYNCLTKKKKRSLTAHNNYVTVTDWNGQLIATGSKDGSVMIHDARLKKDVVKKLNVHESAVCALKWDPTGSKLASGGNDHNVNVYDLRDQTSTLLLGHKAAVKGLAWCPSEPNILATGGGRQDKTIKLWNVSSGTVKHETKLAGTVSSIHFSKYSKEIVASVGKNVQILTYPELKVGKTLSEHQSNILGMNLSPCSTSVVSCSGDETLCFWKVFEDKEKPASNSTSASFVKEKLR